jgi:hypothetical protein
MIEKQMTTQLVLHEFIQGNKTAKVLTRGKNSYRVVLYDFYTEFMDEAYFDKKEDAKIFAKNWVLKT